MINAIVIYGSPFKKATEIANKIGFSLKIKGIPTNVISGTEAHAIELLNYDLIIFGCSATLNGKLQECFVHFENDLRNINLSGKLVALYACDLQGRDDYCHSIDILEQDILACGAKLFPERLGIEGFGLENLVQVTKWAEDVAEYANNEFD